MKLARFRQAFGRGNDLASPPGGADGARDLRPILAPTERRDRLSGCLAGTDQAPPCPPRPT